tara:strand:- start:9759 stop:10955 length:1197 start_codon:yes stop_codon:yes gene_type:complete
LINIKPVFNGTYFFLITIILIYSSIEMSRFGLENLQFLVKAACSIVLLQFFFYQLILKGKMRTLKHIWFPLFYLFCCFVSIFWSINFQESIVSFFGILIIFSVFFFMNNSCNKVQIIEAVYYSCLFYLIVNIALYPFFGENFFDYLQGKYRFAGITYGAHSIARISLFLLIAALSMLKMGKITKIRFISIFLLSLLFVVLADSRQVYIAMLVVMAIYILFRTNKARIANYFILFSSFTILVACFLYFVPNMESLSRTGNLDEILSLTGRINVWQTCIELINQNPYFGYGFGSAQTIIPNNYFTQFGWTTGSAHNSFIHMALEMGLIIAISFHLYIVFLIIKNFREKNFFNVSILLTLVFLGLLEKSFSGNADFLFLFLLLSSSNLKNENTSRSLSIST